MEQQQTLPAQETLPQFKISLSLRAKLIASTAILLFAVIGFLNLSGILILKDDKQAYTYQSQSVEATLTGKQILTLARHSLDTLRATLASIDPNRPPNSSEVSLLQSFVDAQSDLLQVSLGLYNPKTGAWTEVSRNSRADSLKKEGVTSDQLAITGEQLKPVYPLFLSAAYAFIGLSSQLNAPFLGVVFADLKMQNNPSGIPVAFGVLSLQGFAAASSSNELSILTRSGQLLYDSDPAKLFGNASFDSDPLFRSSISSKVASGALEFDSKDDRYLGSYTLPGLDLVVLSRALYLKAMRATYSLTEKFLLLGTMSISLSVILALLFARSITAPIRNLYDGTQHIAEGKFGEEVKVKSKDEIGALTHSFNFMSKKISGLLEESIAKVRLDNELAIAATVQQTLFPPKNYDDPHFTIRSHFQSATECGGDWWGFFGTGNKVALMIADATGHGFPSALITASARSCFSVLQNMAEQDLSFNYSPASMLTYANRVIYDASMSKIMMTFFIAVIDFETNTLSYSSAGHNPPWLFKKDGGVQSLVATGQRLGESKDLPLPEELTTEVAPGDILLLYTDGLLEGTNVQSKEQYGKKRAHKLAKSKAPEGADSMIQSLVKEFLEFNGDKPLDDDVTLAAVTIIGGVR